MNQQINNNPSISIVMPLYNKEKEVTRSINSVLAQTFDDFELIVVNDGSTDKGPDIVRIINDKRIRIIDQENGGVSVARNRGIKESKAELIAFLDADDEWKPDFLETIWKLKTNFPDCDVFATGYLVYDVDGKYRRPILRGMPASQWEGVLDNYFEIAAASDPPLWSSAVAVSKNSLIEIQGFPEGVILGEDLLTWARLAGCYNIAYCSSPLAIYRLGYTRYQKPTRIPDLPDQVGAALKKLLTEISLSKRAGLRKYIAIWHKHRASTFLRMGWRWQTFIEVIKMGRYWVNKKFFLYLIFILMPEKITVALLEKYHKKNYSQQSSL